MGMLSGMCSRLIYCVTHIILTVSCTNWQNANVSLVAEEFDENFEFTCILEGSAARSAVTWISPLENYEGVKFPPPSFLPPSNMLQNYENTVNNAWIPDGWSHSSALDFPLKPIMDHRWETFPVFVSSNLKFIKLAQFSKENFHVSISVRLKYQARMYLCDSEFLILKGKCFVIYIDNSKISLSFQNSESPLNSLPNEGLDENQWLHLTIGYTYNKDSDASILKLLLPENKKSLQCEKERYAPAVQYLWVQSEEVSLWKPHLYHFLSTNKSIFYSHQIGKTFKVTDNSYCVSLHVALCNTCVVNITTEYRLGIDEYENEAEEVRSFKKKGARFSWKEVKIIRKVTPRGYMKLFLSTQNTDEFETGFWAVDDIRKCELNEIRVANLIIAKRIVNNLSSTAVGKSFTEKVKCLPLRDSALSISKPQTTNNYCQDRTSLGLHCNISCQSIFGEKKENCERKIICMGNTAHGISNCHCAFGYQGLTCKEETECQTGTWGFGCTNKCGYCSYGKCNKYNGICEEDCIQGFVAANCTSPKVVENLHEKESTTNSITIEWDPPAPGTNVPFSYVVNYKHGKYKGCNTSQHEAKSLMETTSILHSKAGNLLPYSEYSFEVAAEVDKIKGKNKKIVASTSAIDIFGTNETPSELRVTHENIDEFPVMAWKEPACSKMKGPSQFNVTFICKNRWCKNNKSLKFLYSNKDDKDKEYRKSVPGLIPYSDYTATMIPGRVNGTMIQQAQLQTTFQTRENAPPKVMKLAVYSRNDSTISLRWKPPYPPHGKLETYHLQYCLGADCSTMDVSPLPCSLWEKLHCADISDLRINSYYTVTVKAKNKGVPQYGEEDYLTKVYTNQSESDPPSNVTVIWEEDIPVLSWKHPDITNGPLVYFDIQIDVKQSENKNLTNFNKIITINSDQPLYSNKMIYLKCSAVYNITVYAVNKLKGHPSKSTLIIMPPPKPSLSIVPSLNHCSDSKCELKIPRPNNTSRLSYLYVIVDSDPTVQDDNMNSTQLLIDSVHNAVKYKTSWLAVAMSIPNNTNEFFIVTLGDGNSTTSKYGTAFNKPIDNISYVYVILENSYLNQSRFWKSIIHSTPIERRTNSFPTPPDETNVALYGLFALLLIPLAIGGWILYRKLKQNQYTTPQCNLVDCCIGNGSQAELVPLELLKPTAVIKPERSSLEVQPLLPKADENVQYTHKVPLEYFEDYVKEAIGEKESGELVEQHSLFIRGQTKPWEYGLKKQNKFKNRYNNLIAYDHSRVKLEKMNNDEFSDYINANYIDGYKKPKAYIATQGPKPTTVCDFWRMIWQEQVTTIVMVANVKEDGKKKTEQYWPNVNTSQQYGSIEVHFDDSQIFANYIFRTLIVTKNNEQRTVKQLHFTSWPDHGIPLYPQSLVPFIKKLLTVSQGAAPIVVHCSAGVGRTGTIILCDYMLRMAAGEDAVDFLATLQQMHDQRPNLVDNPSEYRLAHLVVLEALFGLDTTMNCDHKIEQKVEKLINGDGLYKQMAYLEKVVWQDQAMRPTFISTLNPANSNKNRFPYIVPDGFGRVYLSRYPATDEHSDYINAVEVDGFQTPRQFIVTQQPLPSTILDFWRMVHEKEATTIISLNEIIPQDESSSVFWPEDEEVFELLEFIKISFTYKEEHSTHDVIKITLTYNSEKDDEYKRHVNIVHMKEWAPMKAVPYNINSLIAVWEETAKLSRGNNPTVVTCYDGAKACGVYVALTFVIEKIKLEQICDVCLAVRTVRVNRKQFLTDVEQFELLYKAAVHYLKGFETYSNFPMTNK